MLLFMLALFSVLAWAVCARKRWPLIYVLGNMINFSVSSACGIKQLFSSLKTNIRKWTKATAFNVVKWFFQLVLKALVALHLLSGNNFSISLGNVKERSDDVELGLPANPTFNRSMSLPDLSKFSEHPSTTFRSSSTPKILSKSVWDLLASVPVYTPIFTPSPVHVHTPRPYITPSRFQWEYRHYTLSPKSTSDCNINNNNNNTDRGIDVTSPNINFDWSTINNINNRKTNSDSKINYNNNNNTNTGLETVTFSDGTTFNVHPELARYYNKPAPVNAKKKLTFKSPSPANSPNSTFNDSIPVFSNSAKLHKHFDAFFRSKNLDPAKIPNVTVSPHSSHSLPLPVSPHTFSPVLASHSLPLPVSPHTSSPVLASPHSSHSNSPLLLSFSDFNSSSQTLLNTPHTQTTFTQTSFHDSYTSLLNSSLFNPNRLLFTPPPRPTFSPQPITRTTSLPDLATVNHPTDIGFDFRSTTSIPSNILFRTPVVKKPKRKRDDGIDASNILQETLRKKRVRRTHDKCC